MVQFNCPQCHRAFAAPEQASSVRCPYCGATIEVQPIQHQPTQQPPYGQPQYAYGQPTGTDIGVFDSGPSGKSRGVAGLLAILLGGLGVHYFYCGKAGGGLLCILLTICTCGVWSILTLIQGIMMMTMRSDEFERKYVYSTSTMPLF